jgi:MerR family transcriptional regulator, light-induced transcriptional regulator
VELLRAELIARLLGHDKGGAVSAALVAVRDGAVSISDLYVHVLGPALVEIGAGWQQGRTAVWEEHLASSAVRTIVEALYPEVMHRRSGVPSAGRSALLACPPEEAHELGLRMLSDRLVLAGWRVFYLGPDTPAEDIVAAARDLGVDAVVLTSSTHYHRLRLRELVDGLVARLPGVDIWIGGPAFAGSCDDWTTRHLFPERAVFAGGAPAAPGIVPAACSAPEPTSEEEPPARGARASRDDGEDTEPGGDPAC